MEINSVKKYYTFNKCRKSIVRFHVNRNKFVVDISNPVVISWLIALGFKIQSHEDAYQLTKDLLNVCDANDPYDHINAVFMRDLIVVVVVFDVNRFSGLNDYFNSLDIEF
jgi:hypothetical protein